MLLSSANAAWRIASARVRREPRIARGDLSACHHWDSHSGSRDERTADMSAATDVSARAFVGHRARAKVPSRPKRACRAVHASRESVRASVESSSHRADQASTPSRRDTIVGLTSAFSAVATAALAPPDASAAVKLTPGGLDPNRRFFQTFPPLWEPYFGFGERVTVRRELVPGVVWSLEQEQALGVLAMNVRTTVVKLRRGAGGLRAAGATAEFSTARRARRGRARRVADVRHRAQGVVARARAAVPRHEGVGRGRAVVRAGGPAEHVSGDQPRGFWCRRNRRRF